MLPKKGKKFPKQDDKSSAALNYGRAIAAALRAELGDTHQSTKTVMSWTGVCERTAKNWQAGECGPAGEHLVALLQKSDAVLEAVLRLAGRQSALATVKLQDARTTLLAVLSDLDDLLDQDHEHSVPGSTNSVVVE
jgi:hypothetical protein